MSPTAEETRQCLRLVFAAVVVYSEQKTSIGGSATSLDEACATKHPLRHNIKQESSTKRMFYGQRINFTSGCCYSMPPPCPPPACAPPPPPPLPCPPPPIFAADSLEEEMEATCNNKKLRVIIEDNMTTDPTISKRAIQKAAEEKLRGKFNVICAKGDFTYIAYTDTFCQASNEDVTCYAFKPILRLEACKIKCNLQYVDRVSGEIRAIGMPTNVAKGC
ncbi:ground-like domain protein [Teladorsagia circumcincta]|uniref:Ground-like domain protein n=1 Tax=Teladorsagia circumcincta TaxID=45464 RepID=A0A2G9UBW7_TELCI|nr:ground-like domain protein [Teladorsagia circumcincta]